MADAVPGVCAHAPDRAGQVLRGQQRIRVPAHWFGPAPAPAPVRASTKRSPALANGKAVKANPAAGVNAHIGGWAEISGVAGDYGLVNIAPGRIQG